VAVFTPSKGVVGVASGPDFDCLLTSGESKIQGLRLFIPTFPDRWYRATCAVNFKTAGTSTAWMRLYEDERRIACVQHLGHGMADQMVLNWVWKPRKPYDSLYEVTWEGREATIMGSDLRQPQLLIEDLGP
jgi:hypothetical protein